MSSRQGEHNRDVFGQSQEEHYVPKTAGDSPTKRFFVRCGWICEERYKQGVQVAAEHNVKIRQ
jgi:hypothetical protein